ncbi:hypothetical protein PF007_g15984 [Phytophthora fragariae]|uniref:Uncharacterized protein n=2 Tax=Phytophthora fragariae TaxID=53985 RepID=A0A6A3D8R6_9STRA|nr:hypothetical protein PF003_g36945 [Phytophthora fragariae]KAE8917375.1 hypothetical protein PF009_g32303 [Phytophthora fragariae]KAE9099143.1 hypothetical protein PF007_g15984 [Phytophthora fragariae]KAE9266982.1 hypothetical protein PF008_g31466 [Phytophthora fragariae]
MPPDKDLIGPTLVVPPMPNKFAHPKDNALGSHVLQELLSHFKALVGEELEPRGMNIKFLAGYKLLDREHIVCMCCSDRVGANPLDE